jgi:hypothetical protein
MSTNNMNPKNIILFAALGLGAYMLTMRKATAKTSAAPVWSQSPIRALAPAAQPSSNGNLVNAAASALNSFFGAAPAAYPKIYVPDFGAVNDPRAYTTQTQEELNYARSLGDFNG